VVCLACVVVRPRDGEPSMLGRWAKRWRVPEPLCHSLERVSYHTCESIHTTALLEPLPFAEQPVRRRWESFGSLFCPEYREKQLNQSPVVWGGEASA
jgi:hypothetical protein